MLGNIWQGTEKKEIAVPYYARIVRNYPLSPLVPNAKSRLKALGAPIPQPDPKAVAWMTAEQNAPRQREALIKKPLSLIRTGPGQELRAAATTGKPTMTPDSESETGIDILRGGSPSQGATTTGIVATVTPGSTGGTTSTAESVTPATDGGEAGPSAAADPNAAPTTENSANGTAETTPKTDATPAATGQPGDPSKTDETPAAAGQTSDAAKTAQDGKSNSDNKKESTSKKKKGLKKIVPW